MRSRSKTTGSVDKIEAFAVSVAVQGICDKLGPLSFVTWILR